jgi:hypothetical protein
VPTIKRSNTLLAGVPVQPLVGSQYEYLPFDALVQIAIRQDPAGDATATAFSGTDLLLEDSPVDEKAAADPITFPEDYDVQDVAAAGERLGVTLRSAAGGAVVRTVVRITPL